MKNKVESGILWPVAEPQKPALMAGFFMRGRMGRMRFSIRDLLLLVLVVALALGWWFDRRNTASRFQLQSSATHGFVIDTATGQVWEIGIRSDGAATGDVNAFTQPKPMAK
jgi:hypothetical protein